MKDDSKWVVLAELLRPQGRKGELLAELYTDFPERFKHNRRVYLAKADFDGTPEQAREAEVTSYWLPLGKNQGRVVLQFVGIDSITAAEGIAGLEVIVPREERLLLEDESNYISDLIGCIVYDGETPVGSINDVQFTTSPDGLRRLEEIAPMLVVSSADGEELLIPFAKDFLVTIDAAAKRVEMALPVGLLDVNR
ncbi:MAG: rRNA processing protein RimM [Acidobacteriaceae bacterium]|nr:rRNA processing protein RimM [Acidobacteriaceae bacterium]